LAPTVAAMEVLQAPVAAKGVAWGVAEVVPQFQALVVGLKVAQLVAQEVELEVVLEVEVREQEVAQLVAQVVEKVAQLVELEGAQGEKLGSAQREEATQVEQWKLPWPRASLVAMALEPVVVEGVKASRMAPQSVLVFSRWSLPFSLGRRRYCHQQHWLWHHHALSYKHTSACHYKKCPTKSL